MEATFAYASLGEGLTNLFARLTSVRLPPSPTLAVKQRVRGGDSAALIEAARMESPPEMRTVAGPGPPYPEHEDRG